MEHCQSPPVCSHSSDVLLQRVQPPHFSLSKFLSSLHGLYQEPGKEETE